MKRPSILVALGRTETNGVPYSRVEEVCSQLTNLGYDVERVDNAADAVAIASSQADLAAALVSWELPGTTSDMREAKETGAEGVLRVLMDHFSSQLPVYLLTTGDYMDDTPLWVSEVINGWVYLLEDTPSFIAGRVDNASSTYRQRILPPFFRRLRRFDDTHEYSWHTPSHHGGVAFLKSPVGRAFHDYYGEQLLRSDISISVGELGSLFEHTGPIGEAEKNAARIFGADETYFVLHGSSTSVRMLLHGTVAHDEIVLLDRNCHKAINHGIILSLGRPVYLVPTRNGYGLTGPIPPKRMVEEAVREQIEKSPLAKGAVSQNPASTVITNSTYDGLCYDAVRVAEMLAPCTRSLQFDEAWFGYAHFNPLYQRRYGMAIDTRAVDGGKHPTVFASQSTHKLLAALSQSAMVHVKQGTKQLPAREIFDETYMMHATTSPLYPMIASLDIAAGMMEGPSGRWLTTEAITEAIRFRQAVVRLGKRLAEAGDRPKWFFGVWQPEEVTDPETKRAYEFHRAPLDLLQKESSCWVLDPDDTWHGFSDLEDDFCLLDPIKVTITCPGVNAQGKLDSRIGIPARIVTAYLETRQIVVEKTDLYTFLLLFSMGITKGKWGTLLDALTDFKKLYDDGAPLGEVLPGLVQEHPERYGKLTLPALCQEMHTYLSDNKLMQLLNDAFTGDTPPTPVLTPAEAYQKFIQGDTELRSLDELPGHVVATQIAITPPGIPVLMPGERVGDKESDLMKYLTLLEAFDQRFPGFASETHGVHHEDGKYFIRCVEEEK
ncbi:arginine decarboxylase [Streptomyces piniterrae]|uniref:Arginine decarboxylase n=1 Tax=Streptomyces piniterrae TaxID=2571125 RepID=A0A4V5MIA1_9ACTN|nr:Orn/Lys/Arg decarboxylase N-terminal domain-containing protein [Streptomyces piniterrae]TJZ44598.1 arginine decarboxylase [Streptomyces piniterrae]